MIICVRTVAVPPDERDAYIAWIATPERDRLTKSDVHRAVDYRPLSRYEITAGYLNLPGLAHQPDTFPTTEDTP